MTAPTWKPCPEKVCRHSPVLGAHTLTVASSEPEMTALPEVVNMTQDTLLSCPANTCEKVRQPIGVRFRLVFGSLAWRDISVCGIRVG